MSDLSRGPHGPLRADAVAVLDTETTGLFPAEGDRICTVGVVVLARQGGGWRPRARLELACDPLRPVHPKATEVSRLVRLPPHARVPEGMSDLAGLPTFPRVAPLLWDLLGDLPIACHHAPFDVAFLDAERRRLGLPPIASRIVCTKTAFSDALGLGRSFGRIPGTSLNTLCQRLGIDLSARRAPDGGEVHGALADAEITAEALARLDALGWLLPVPAHVLPHRQA